MSPNDLILPTEVAMLIDLGLWPIDRESAMLQNIEPLVEKSLLNTLIPDERTIYFYCPPFKTVQQLIDNGEKFWLRPEAALNQIQPEKTLVIGDFGSGSDTVLALDYSQSAFTPKVIRLVWTSPPHHTNNHWSVVSVTFKDFCTSLRLGRV